MKYLRGFTNYNPLNKSKTVFETDGKHVYETHYANYADNIPVYFRRKISKEHYENVTGHSFEEQIKQNVRKEAKNEKNKKTNHF